MRKLFFYIVLILVFCNIFALNLEVKKDGTGDYTTIQAAMNAIGSCQQGTAHSVTVFADNNQETVYAESVMISGNYEIKFMCNPDDVGLVVIDSGVAANGGTGMPAIKVGPDSGYNKKVTIENFIIRRSSYLPQYIDENGIVATSCNVGIGGCVFGSRANNENFNKSIYFYNEYEKNRHALTVSNCEFNQACNIDQYPIYCTGISSNSISYFAYFINNNFINCGNGIFAEQAQILKALDNTMINTGNIGQNMIGINFSITALDFFPSLICDNKIEKTDTGVIVNSVNRLDIISNELIYQTNGFMVSGTANILRNLIHIYKDSLDCFGIINNGLPSFSGNTLLVTESSTATATSTAIVNNNEFYLGHLLNNIIWNFDQNIVNNTTNDIELNYSCYNGSIQGFEPSSNNENLDNIDPEFISENPASSEFCHIEDYSPCVDAGDQYVGSVPDGSIPDIGWYSTTQSHDTKTIKPSYNWVSFPRLRMTDNNGGDQDIIPVLFQLVDELNSIAADTEEEQNLNFYFEDNTTSVLKWDSNNTWHQNNYSAYSFRSYKIETSAASDITFNVAGEVLNPDYVVNFDNPIPAGKDIWLGYWLPETQDIDDAFGPDFWSKVKMVKAKDWCYLDTNSSRSERGKEPIPSMKIRPLEYGKGYIVRFKESVSSFYWTDSSQTSQPFTKQTPINFNYVEKADYEIIDLMNIPEGVEEVGVFENGICLGAVVVQDSADQVLVYSDATNRDTEDFTFELFYGGRSTDKVVKYEVLNQYTGKYEAKPLQAGRNEYSVVRFNSNNPVEQSGDNILNTEIYRNYPNPFNPTTIISFSLPTEQNIELEIYNSRGQIVKILYYGNAEKGTHSIVWNGKDSKNNSVSSGVYFYKLKTQNETFNRKMLLMK
jgi:hypothetical protein